MRPLQTRTLAVGIAALATLGCSGGGTGAADEGEAAASPNTQDFQREPICSAREPQPALGLMTSLPIYWELGQGLEEFARGQAERPWQRTAISQCYSIVPLDTLSPIAGLSPRDPETDPLEGIEKLAIIQPRGLSPSDNVALDQWVRAGGRLLLVLDPMLTGEYDLPLGDPRRPVDSAAIPPVVKRWGMQVSYTSEQELALKEARLGPGYIWLSLPGQITRDKSSISSCKLAVDDAIARCRIEKGWVTLLADAASFEHSPEEVASSMAGELPLLTVMQFAFEPETSKLNEEVAAP